MVATKAVTTATATKTAMLRRAPGSVGRSRKAEAMAQTNQRLKMPTRGSRAVVENPKVATADLAHRLKRHLRPTVAAIMLLNTKARGSHAATTISNADVNPIICIRKIQIQMSMMEISNRRTTNRLIGLLAGLMIMIMSLDGCASKPNSYSEFHDVPAKGWHIKTPFTFTPQYGDSSCLFDVKLVVRHTNKYRFQNLAMIVDVIDTAYNVKREKVDVDIADTYGNWVGSGFGTLYQREVVVFRGLKPEEAKSIAVWQRMPNCSFVDGLSEVGVIIVPERQH